MIYLNEVWKVISIILLHTTLLLSSPPIHAKKLFLQQKQRNARLPLEVSEELTELFYFVNFPLLKSLLLRTRNVFTLTNQGETLIIIKMVHILITWRTSLHTYFHNVLRIVPRVVQMEFQWKEVSIETPQEGQYYKMHWGST